MMETYSVSIENTSLLSLTGKKTPNPTKNPCESAEECHLRAKSKHELVIRHKQALPKSFKFHN